MADVVILPEADGAKGSLSRSFSLSITLLRRLGGLTQEDVARRLGVSVTTYCNLEKGVSPTVRFEYLESLSVIFKVEPWELLNFSELVRRYKGRKAVKV